MKPSKSSQPIVFEVHPDWGDRIAGYALQDKDANVLGTWYETGADISVSQAWVPRQIYLSVPFPPSSGGVGIDWVLKLADDDVDGDTVPPPSGGPAYEMGATWALQSGSTLTVDPGSAAWAAVFKVFVAAANGGSGWVPSGDPIGVLAEGQTSGALVWWCAADASVYGSSPSAKVLTVSDATTTLYFQVQSAKVKLTAPSGLSWYEIEDPVA